MSTYLTGNSNIYCFPQAPCFAVCNQYLVASPTSATTYNFGPSYSSRSYYGGTCICTDFNIYNAQLVTYSQLNGASNGGNPFSLVTALGLTASYLVQVRWTAGNGAGTCSLNYYLTSGPNFLGVGYYYFSYWWIILVSILGFLFFMCFLGIVARSCSKRGSSGDIFAPPPATTSAINDPMVDSPGYVYTTSSTGQYAQPVAVPIATAVPMAIGSAGAAGGAPVPVAIEAPTGNDNLPHSGEAREVAIV
jgi:hypothetical protein